LKQIDELIKQINNFKNQYKILFYFINKLSEYEKNLLNSIKTLQLWLDSLDKCNYQKGIEKSTKEFFNDFSKSFNEYQEKIQNVINMLKELENIKNNIIMEKEKFSLKINFDPLKIESLSFSDKIEKKVNSEYEYNNSLNKTPSLLQSFLDDKEEVEKSNKNESLFLNEGQKEYLICQTCKKKADFMYKNNYYCKNCSEENSLDFKKIQIIKTNSSKLYEFLNSVSICIKLILLKSNYLIKLGNIETIQSKQGSKIMPIKRFEDINYPFIKDHDNANCIDFLIDIDKTLDNKCNFKHEIFEISNLDKKLIESLKYIFNDENKNIFLDSFTRIDNDFSFEDFDNDIFCINQIKMDNNYIKYISPKRFYYYYNSYKKINEQNVKKNKINLNDESIIKNDSKQKKVNKREKLSYEQIFYMIEYLYDNKDKNNKEKEDEIIRIMKNILKYEKSKNIMKYLFNDFLITTENILKLSINEIIINFPTLNELYEFKILVDDFASKELGLKDFIDYKYNFINAPKNIYKIKGIRMHIFIPFGWFGIGVKYETIEDDEWVDALLGIGENLPLNEVMEILENNIINGLIKHNNQEDKNNKSIGSKVYFSSQIRDIETHSGCISFYGSKYRIVFIVKIKKNMLKNVDNINLCNLSKENVKIQTILLKKIKY
jgi:hypothetical protein